ncbi:thioredoxin family protein [Streptomyces sp. NPDC094466]|uniref:thioredoxin family protein n=1 Tax=Streptomyces sp. NPDC094466 TaxID=3366065 RepID=UPI00380F40AE
MAGKTVELSDDTFQAAVLKSALPVLVHFSAEWAGPSKMMVPVLEDLAADYNGRLTIGDLDIDRNPATHPNYDVPAVPTFLLFRGGAVVAQKVGPMSKGQMVEFLDAHL